MKKLIVLAMIMAVMVSLTALVHAQAPANDLKPTFISPTPGLYVNGWPPSPCLTPRSGGRHLSRQETFLPPGVPDRMYPRVVFSPYSGLVSSQMSSP